MTDHAAQPGPSLRHYAALLAGNAALALGPMWVRMADCGPVSSAFWRLALALPIIAVLALRQGPLPITRARGGSWALAGAIVGAGMFFALDLAAWHMGIPHTRLGDATLFGNAGSVVVAAWGLVTAHRRPRATELAAMAAALAGAAILFGRSLEISHASFVGDCLCLGAGLLYAGYILLARRGRSLLGNWQLLLGAGLTGAPLLLALALATGERVWPGHWGPLLTLALTSQVLGQGLLVMSLRHFPPLVIGLALLTQPVIAVAIGAWFYGEALAVPDIFGMLLVGAALVLVRAGEPRPAD